MKREFMEVFTGVHPQWDRALKKYRETVQKYGPRRERKVDRFGKGWSLEAVKSVASALRAGRSHRPRHAVAESGGRMNRLILDSDNIIIKRFFNLDSNVYEDGALSSRTKELLGLTASLVLRCDDCITYHLLKCRESGVTTDEFFEVFSVALIVGGSITIPHIRRAAELILDR